MGDTIHYIRCGCGESVSIKGQRLHIKYDCANTPEFQRRDACRLRDLRKARRGNSPKTRERERKKELLERSTRLRTPRKCENPECGTTYQPRAVTQRACSQKCRDAIRYLEDTTGLPRRDLDQEHMKPFEVATREAFQLAEAAAKRLKSQEEIMRLWAACLDVPALASVA